MSVSTADRAAFEHYLAGQRGDAHDASLTLNARAFVAQLLERAGDPVYLRRYAETCPVPGAEPEHYAARVMQVAPTCSVIAAIHFRGLATDFPFVDVSAQSGPLPRPLPLVLLAAPFARFQPRAVRVWRFSAAALIQEAEDDLIVVGGSVRALQMAPDLPGAPADSARAGFRSGVVWRVSAHVRSRAPDYNVGRHIRRT